MPRLRVVAVVAAAAFLVAAGSEARSTREPRADTRERMQAIFGALSTALNLSLYETPFESRRSRELVAEALRTIADDAGTLAIHDQLDPGIEGLRRSLARDASEATIRYRQRQYEGVRFMLDQLVSNCVGCHARLPATGDFNLAKAFVDRARIERLPRMQRLRLLVATRQFEEALALYEAALSDRGSHPDDLVGGNVVADYLRICLNVRRDPDRAIDALHDFSRRKDVSDQLAARITSWMRSIEAVRGNPNKGDPLGAARRMVREARASNDFPGDNRGLARFILASGLLQRYLERGPADSTDVAEAYYLLGVCGAYTTTSPWTSQTQFYLESAVRRAPHAPCARPALHFLEAYLATQYSGSSGTVMPDDVRERLEALHRLIDTGP